MTCASAGTTPPSCVGSGSTSPLPNSAPLAISTRWSGYTSIYGDGRALGVGQGTDGRVGSLAGRIRLEELIGAISSQGYINHALAIAVNCTNGQGVYPASVDHPGQTCQQIGLDGGPGTSTADAPPMGARIWLNMSFSDISTLASQYNIPQWKQVILRTLSKYGAIIMDTGVDDYFVIQTESGNQYTSMSDPTATPPLVVPDAWHSFGACMQAGSSCPAGLGAEIDWYCHDSSSGTCKNRLGDFTGVFQNTNDGLNTWTTLVWNKLQVLDPCVSDGRCNP